MKFKKYKVRIIGIVGILLCVFAIYNLTLGINEILYSYDTEFKLTMMVSFLAIGIILLIIENSMLKKYNQQIQQIKVNEYNQKCKIMWDEDKNKCYILLTNNPHLSTDTLAANIEDRFHSTKENCIWVTLIVKALLNEGKFPGAYLDAKTNSLAFPEKPAPKNMEYQTIICNKCGASNKINTGSVYECEYCGNPLK